MKTKTAKTFASALVGALALVATVGHAQDTPKPAVLITNARIFDGKSNQLTGPMNYGATAAHNVARLAEHDPRGEHHRAGGRIDLQPIDQRGSQGW